MAKFEFNYSKNGIPYIDMGEHGQLTFSKLTSHPIKGYKYVTFKRLGIETIKIKNSSPIDVPIYHSYTFDLSFKRGETSGVPRDAMPRRIVDYLIKVFDSLSEGDYISHKNIKLLEEILVNTDIEEVLNEPQREIKAKKKRGRKKKKLLPGI